MAPIAIQFSRAMEMRMSSIALEKMSEIETAIAEAIERVERQRQLIA